MKNRKTGQPLSPQVRRLTLTGVLGALALVFSALEGMLPPLPMLPPGAKLGLSNIVTMYAAGSLGLVPALGIALVKGLFAGLTRGFTAFLMSTCGGLLSTFVVWLLFRGKRGPVFGCLGLGVCGALAHNAAQLLVAVALTTPALLYAYAPWLLVFGVLSGILTGLVLRVILPFLNKFSP